MQTNVDHSLFLSKMGYKIKALIRYEDYIIVTGNVLKVMCKLKDCLSSEFDMKDFGGLKYFFGIEVSHSNHGIFMSQCKYIFDFLEETEMFGYEQKKVSY